SLDHRVQVALKRLEGQLGDVAIGVPGTAAVVADELEPVGQELPQVGPGRVLPVVLRMAGEERHAHERHAAPDPRHRDADAIARAAKGYALLAGGPWALRSGRQARRRSGRLRPDLTDEAEALAGDGADEALHPAIVAEGLPRSVDAGGNGRV